MATRRRPQRELEGLTALPASSSGTLRPEWPYTWNKARQPAWRRSYVTWNRKWSPPTLPAVRRAPPSKASRDR
eukprot:10501269-Alexandrium_andersonii.AAC.1